MRHWFVPLAFVLALGAAPSTARAQSATVLDAETLLRLGDAAYREGRLDEARKALLYALEQRPGDPTIAGVLGRVEADRGRWTRAVELLDDALHGNGGRTAVERDAFARAFARARDEVAVVRMRFNVAPAVVLVDGERLSFIGSNWYGYSAPGEHVLEAEAPGYKRHRERYTAAKGGTVRLDVQLAPEEPAAVVPKPEAAEKPRAAPQEAPKRKPAERPRAAPADALQPSRKLLPVELHVRGWTSLGFVAAGWTVPGLGVGPIAATGVSWWHESRPIADIGVEVRALRALGKIERAQSLDVWGLGFYLPGCAHAGREMVCAVFGVDFIDSDRSRLFVRPVPVVGLRFGAQLPIASHFRARVWVDLLFRGYAPGVMVKDERVWTGTNSSLSLGFAPVWIR